ncbi:probable insulin-like peptide 7 [Biomphalaria glabrata]|uniref:Probable insulin-like peptide 7 n=1 Tax=Biomphalaria glabrata TaxID=6526 RepID=A0A9U8EFU6_BIOGL|nr:probable insulin-like peptide 7 [Biomphalaria glabrata]
MFVSFSQEMVLNNYDSLTPKSAVTMFSTCVLAYLVLSWHIGTSSASVAEEQAFYTMARNRFATANRDDLLYIWHHDCHRRCFYQIEEHFEISCAYDPYIARPRRSVHEIANTTTGLTANKQPKNEPSINGNELETRENSARFPFLSKRDAKSFLRSKRAVDQPLSRGRRGIMHECCFTKACSWEEYAEYCHRNPRTTTAMENNCSYS